MTSKNRRRWWGLEFEQDEEVKPKSKPKPNCPREWVHGLLAGGERNAVSASNQQAKTHTHTHTPETPQAQMEQQQQQFSIDDNLLHLLLQSASDFANYPGFLNDAAVKDFLDRFPLPLIFHALQTKADVEDGVESTLIGCLERIFKSKYGASLIPTYMAFVQFGLQSGSQAVRCLACKAVASLLDNVDGHPDSLAQLVIDHRIYPLLLDCVCTGNEEVATSSIYAIKKLAGSPKGMEIIFPANYNEATHLSNLAAHSSSLGRVRVLSLIVNLFSVSPNVASAVYSSNLLTLLEAEVSSTNDTLVTLSVLELLYELAEVQHSAEFLSRTTLLQLLSAIISNPSMDAILRSRAMMISGRLLGKENIYMFIDESSVKGIISAIDGRLELGIEDLNECEAAIEALGQIGLCKYFSNQSGPMTLATIFLLYYLAVIKHFATWVIIL
ncbi:hypothetical protein Tsubulata_000971 [Turnera subulata]|uniref:ARM repeat superfamily protein n=1 Tax=Turnera subulata TaxID=218843 RepID=A0A9Q0FD37_9ROSI|nr:hypothetical protein Tsubulata_000971 [Turnera subulata]